MSVASLGGQVLSLALKYFFASSPTQKVQSGREIRVYRPTAALLSVCLVLFNVLPTTDYRAQIVDYVTWSQLVGVARHVFVCVLLRLIFIHISLKAAKNVQWSTYKT